MDSSSESGQYDIKGGKTILGRIFAYQEKTGLSVNDILNLPYIMFVLGMYDAPSIDYDSKKKGKKRNTKPKTAGDQAASITSFLG